MRMNQVKVRKITIGNIGEDFEPAQGITESSDVSENVEQTL